MKKRILATIMAMAMVVTAITPQIFATVDDIQSATVGESVTTNVKYSQTSTFSVIVPKVITLDSNKTSSYTVDVNGDIASNEKIVVVPDATVTMKDVNSIKADVTGTIEQDKTEWLYNDMDVNATGLVSAQDLTAGTWKGVFYFNIALKGNNSLITVEAKNESGEDLNASASEITSTKKDTLLSNLVDTGLINSVDEVDALIEVESDEFDGMAETTFNVSNIANEGDKITILHFNEKTNEWEYISTETVNSDGTITANFSSYSPVAFVKVNEDGSYEVVTEQAGLYDADGNLLCTWEESGIDVKKDYSDWKGDSNFYEKFTTSPYYVLTNNYPTATKVIIPDGVTKIGQYAFGDCTNLTSITIPEGVTSIENGTFYNCTSLTKINIPDGVTSIGEDAFSKCGRLTSITIPEGVTSIGNYAFIRCSSLTNINIPDSVTSIGNSAFYYCKRLTSINIPDGVTSISEFAFDGCSRLTSVTIPDSVTSIGENAFADCTRLTSINIPDGVTSIGRGAFYKCISLTSITIPESVTSIGISAFSNCTSLTSVTIPDGVTSIGGSAFYWCSSLTSINIPDGVTKINASTFAWCESLTNINIPDGVTSIGNSAFADCTSLTSITIPDGVTSIDIQAFYGCSSLTSITIPDSVTSIGESAFRDCTNLTSVTFENPTNWYIGASAGELTTAISSSDLSNTSTAATYLKSWYYSKYWSRT